MWWNNDPRDSLPSWHQYMPKMSMTTRMSMTIRREDEIMKQGTIQIPKGPKINNIVR